MIKNFKLGGVEWKIEVANKELDGKQRYGETDYNNSTIKIQTETYGQKRSKLGIEQTLYHEITHAILFTLGESELSDNEKFVQQFSLLFHQVIKSQK